MKIPNSARLSYRLMTRDDANLLFELDQNPEVMRYVNNSKTTTWDEIETVYIPRMEEYTNLKKGWGLWMVTVEENQAFIGWVLVRPKNFFSDNPDWDNLELGWRFKQEYWGKGFATEAAAQIKQAQINSKLNKKLSAIAVKDNLASMAIMKKIGMKYINTYVHHDPVWGHEEVVYYEMEVG